MVNNDWQKELDKAVKLHQDIIATYSKPNLIYAQNAVIKLAPVITHINNETTRIRSISKYISKYTTTLNHSKYNEFNNFLKDVASLNSITPLDISYQSTTKLNDEILESNKSSELKEPAKELIPNTKIIKELQNKLYNMSHGLIAPFKDKGKLQEHLSYLIFDEILTSLEIPMPLKVVLIFILSLYSSNTKEK